VAAQELPKVSIIVASYNNEQTILDCLKSILSLDYPKDHFEVIVMDGVSKDKTVEIAQELQVQVVSIKLNCPAAYNYVMKIAKYPILGFVDSDAKVEPNWLRLLVTHLDEPEVAGVSGTIETWNSNNPWAKNIGFELKNRYSRIGQYTGRIATMNLLMKRAVIDQAGGWDEELPSQYDTDLGFRVSAKGFKIAYEPKAVCYHFNRPTLRAYYRQQMQYGKNTLRLYFKHGHLARGDEITDVGMNIQPILLLALFTSLIVGIIPPIRLLWYISVTILASMLIYFGYSAAKIKLKFHDVSTWRLVVLYFVRSFAWFVGALKTAVNFLVGKGGKKHGA
jgi:cellulose synthase/poly-beta-1,6-N-acetylglucosamine synthase-like glycosyltransferase